ncbi:MAG: glycosyltransferase family 4 protein [Bacteroidales bacterium]|nr:glycosyltransferase family 4 protein [Bacteroidales bacterium]
MKTFPKSGNNIENIKNILFIAPLYPDRAPSQRFRFEQYLEFFRQNGYDYDFSYLVNPKNDKTFYAKGKVFDKALLQLDFAVKRFQDVISANKYDIVFIQREAFYLGTTIFEYLFSRSKAKLVYDFDDSIWLPNVSDANVKYDWLKNYNKTAKIIAYADLVIAGNEYLKNYALAKNKNVIIIPTTIDTEEYKPIAKKEKKQICIGWSGSITTIQHFKKAIPVLSKIREKYGNQVSFKVIGDASYTNEQLDIKGIAWQKSNEIEELSEFDIGIMPLPDSEWAKGKCGLKGLQYMALEIPTIMSPVGVNSEIISDGENGFLADSDEQWVDRISLLIENKELRNKIGSEGRKTVIEKYSVESQKHRYLEAFNKLT